MQTIDNMDESHHIIADTIWVEIPFSKLTCCLNKPMYTEMMVIHKEIYQNLATILSTFCTNHGRILGIIMPEIPISSAPQPRQIP